MKHQKSTIRACLQAASLLLLSLLLLGHYAFAADKGSAIPLVGPSSQNERALAVATAFKNGEVIPKQFTGDGADVSPPLRWSEPPAATKSIAVICYDPDSPGGTWYHWLLYNLPGRTVSLEQNVPKQPSVLGEAEQGINDFRRIGYSGPAPPPGAKHRYFFRVIALDEVLPLKAEARKDAVMNAIKGHIVAEGGVMGIYWR